MGDVDELLNEAIQLGFIDVVGITPKGDWLYGPTKKTKEILSIQDVALAIQALKEHTEDQ